ncbi:hypothetical protein Rcae01_06607 [Novipirellula caenicola]|uniref:Uncharacterized protein n=1 Tax=Novipirellula caenicola TaxID=1536901 RepID=A0ABP9W139_9BACT
MPDRRVVEVDRASKEIPRPHPAAHASRLIESTSPRDFRGRWNFGIDPCAVACKGMHRLWQEESCSDGPHPNEALRARSTSPSQAGRGDMPGAAGWWK